VPAGQRLSGMMPALERLRTHEAARMSGHLALSILLGVLAGLGGVLFHFLLEQARMLLSPGEFISRVGPLWYYVTLILVPLAGSLVAAAMTILAPAIAAEKGVLSVIKAVMIRDGRIPLRNTLFHFFAPVISIGSGAPLGPESPSAQIGAGIGSFMAQVLKLDAREMRMYAAAGAGAAIAAVFGAPIAGVFFGIEVILLNDLKNSSLSALVISCVVADIVSHAFIDESAISSGITYSLGTVASYPWFIVLALVCGLVSLLYLKSADIGKAMVSRLPTSPIARVVPVALLFGAALCFIPEIFGTGYMVINGLVAGNYTPVYAAQILALRFVFIVLFISVGAYGGTFAPALVLGSLTGYLTAALLNIFGIGVDPVLYALVGMGGLLAGINSVPLTAIMLVFEITNDYRLIWPLMFVSVVSYLVYFYFTKRSVYAGDLAKSGIDVSRRGEADVFGKLLVREIMTPPCRTVDRRANFRKTIGELLDSDRGEIFVTGNRGRFAGYCSIREVREALKSSDLSDLVVAADLTVAGPVLLPDECVSGAVEKFGEHDIEIMAVVDSPESMRPVGAVTRKNVFAAYRRLLDAWEAEEYLIRHSYRR